MAKQKIKVFRLSEMLRRERNQHQWQNDIVDNCLCSLLQIAFWISFPTSMLIFTLLPFPKDGFMYTVGFFLSIFSGMFCWSILFTHCARNWKTHRRNMKKIFYGNAKAKASAARKLECSKAKEAQEVSAAVACPAASPAEPKAKDGDIPLVLITSPPSDAPSTSAAFSPFYEGPSCSGVVVEA